jgi:hypothetical protein
MRVYPPRCSKTDDHQADYRDARGGLLIGKQGANLAPPFDRSERQDGGASDNQQQPACEDR